MIWVTSILIVVLIAIVIIAICSSFNNNKSNEVPFVPQFAIAKIYLQLIFNKNIPLNLREILFQTLNGIQQVAPFNKTGIIKIKVGPYVSYILTSAEAVQPILKSLVLIEKTSFYTSLAYLFGENGLAISPLHKWKRHRAMVTPAFHNLLKSYVPAFISSAQNLVKVIKSKGQKLPNGGFLVKNYHEYLSLYTLDVFCETSMGYKLDALKNKNVEYSKAADKLIELAAEKTSKPWLGLDIIFKLTAAGKGFKKHKNIVDNFAQKMVDEYNSNKGKQQIDNKRHLPLLDSLMVAFRSGSLSKQELLDLVNSFLLAGHHTTSMTLNWTLFMIGNHPEVQKKIRTELLQNFLLPIDGANIEDVTGLDYLDMVIKETLRLYPVAPWISRKLTHKIEICGHQLPSGIDVILNVYAVNRNPKYWVNPNKFNPNNFSPENVAARHPYAFIPFSAGPRNCIGYKFALKELKVVLAVILSNFKVNATLKPDQIIIDFANSLVPRPELDIEFIPY